MRAQTRNAISLLCVLLAFASSGAADTAKQTPNGVASGRVDEAAKRLRDDRPPIADPDAHLRTFVEFLQREATDPQQFVLNALDKHRVVILGEIHHRPRYYAFNMALVRSPEFARQVGVIYMEVSSDAQPLVDRFLAASKHDPEPVIEALRTVLVEGWPDRAELDFFRTVWEVNQELPKPQRLRIVLVDVARPWKQWRNSEDIERYEKNVNRDQCMAENIVRDLEAHVTDKRHALFIVGYGHAMQNLTFPNGEPIKSAGWHLRTKLGERNVYAVFPHGPVITNSGQVSGRLARGLFECAFAAMGNKPMSFPLDHGPFGKQVFDASPDLPTTDPYSKAFHAYLYLGPLEDELHSSVIPGFYTDGFVQEVDRRTRLATGKGIVEYLKEKGLTITRLDGASFTALIMDSAGPFFGARYDGKSWGWSKERLGPLDSWRHAGGSQNATLNRVPSPPSDSRKQD